MCQAGAPSCSSLIYLCWLLAVGCWLLAIRRWTIGGIELIDVVGGVHKAQEIIYSPKFRPI